jgi:RNA polymerase sigma factor (sigma-70 family)
MANTALGSLLHYLRRLHDRAAAEATDGELLRRHVAGDKAAFAALLRRHAPMVWSVCRRLLDNEQDAEDTFQAAFLVLLRKAESLRIPHSVAAFLHGVASRIARKAQATAQRRRRHEAQAAMPRSSDPFVVVEQQELRALLEEELGRLPEKYRAPLVLCYLEGLSYTEAARQLGWRDGTVCGRLARARELLRQRLSRRGLTLSGTALAAALSESTSAPASR